MIVVIFNEDFRASEALRIPRATVEQLFPHREHVNGRIITFTDELRAAASVEVIHLSDAALDRVSPTRRRVADRPARARSCEPGRVGAHSLVGRTTDRVRRQTHGHGETARSAGIRASLAPTARFGLPVVRRAERGEDSDAEPPGAEDCAGPPPFCTAYDELRGGDAPVATAVEDQLRPCDRACASLAAGHAAGPERGPRAVGACSLAGRC